MQRHAVTLSLTCLTLAIASIGLSACSSEVTNTNTNTSVPIIDLNAIAQSVQPAYFLEKGLVEPISTVSCSLSDGSTGDCYKIVTKNTPSDVGMGPWCPSNIADDASKGGIWLENGEVYDVDGKFIQNLAEFYGDSNWNMYNKTTGEIIKTSTLEECVATANPNVGAEYRNYCVECLPEYVTDLSETFYIPVTPKPAATITKFGGPGPHATGPSVRGIAFNGVRFDAPAPVSNILAAYTIAPFDDAGGHINPNAGYHYHAATGMTTAIAQDDGHAPMIGYALDGYGLYANTDTNAGAESNEYTDLDAARGHEDSVRGYHYHVDKAGNNNFINGLRGVYAINH
ncbi:YHYH protein [Psychrobacter sp. 2Y5]|uniref:YHYH protein n=1 Tax=unclassified Psychrobacter TaxID=196806 RepID=UPI003F45BC08